MAEGGQEQPGDGDLWVKRRPALRDLILAGAADWDLAVAPAEVDTLLDFAGEMLAANRQVNLTGITDPVEVAVKHLLDALTPLLCGIKWQGLSVLDLGTGPGVPGIPLAIVLGDAVRITLLDARLKKVRFCRQVIRRLGLAQVSAHHDRAETWGRDQNRRESFGGVVARAVAPIPVLAELALPLVRPGGWFLAMKGPSGAEEWRQAEEVVTRLGGSPDPEITRVSLPREMGERRLILVKTAAASPPKYPRRPGIPEKKPLGSAD